MAAPAVRDLFDSIKVDLEIRQNDPKSVSPFTLIVGKGARHIPAASRADAEHIRSAIRYAEWQTFRMVQFKFQQIVGVFE